jgi:hypothetical protein
LRPQDGRAARWQSHSQVARATAKLPTQTFGGGVAEPQPRWQRLHTLGGCGPLPSRVCLLQTTCDPVCTASGLLHRHPVRVCSRGDAQCGKKITSALNTVHLCHYPSMFPINPCITMHCESLANHARNIGACEMIYLTFFHAYSLIERECGKKLSFKKLSL